MPVTVWANRLAPGFRSPYAVRVTPLVSRRSWYGQTPFKGLRFYYSDSDYEKIGGAIRSQMHSTSLQTHLAVCNSDGSRHNDLHDLSLRSLSLLPIDVIAVIGILDHC
ncbi:hypothetical protein TNCV_4737371 [Trichonephila clavipes]|nr:hypothetical protein TNCV_4737371 [Trichonephila clavipes]